MCLGGLVMLAIWISGNLWGQGQAGQGDCWLMRKVGRSAGLPLILLASQTLKVSETFRVSGDADSLVETIRFDPDPEKRRAALVELEQNGFVEHLS